MKNCTEKDRGELLKDLELAKKGLFDLFMKKSSGQLDKHHLLSSVKKQIAKIKTFFGEKSCKWAKKTRKSSKK